MCKSANTWILTASSTNAQRLLKHTLLVVGRVSLKNFHSQPCSPSLKEKMKGLLGELVACFRDSSIIPGALPCHSIWYRSAAVCRRSRIVCCNSVDRI